MDDKLNHWNFACEYFGWEIVSHDNIVMAACNAFCSSESPLCYFIDKKNYFAKRFQNDFFFSEHDSIFDFWRESYSDSFNRFCLQISKCIEVCSAYGDSENAMKLLRYKEEHNLYPVSEALKL